jgi:hypothetical protein
MTQQKRPYKKMIEASQKIINEQQNSSVVVNRDFKLKIKTHENAPIETQINCSSFCKANFKQKVYAVFALVVVAARYFGAGNFVVSNSLMLGGMNTFSKVLTTFGLEKNPITLAVFVPTFRKL